MRTFDLLKTLDSTCRGYLEENTSTIPNIEQEAILVDFINYVGAMCGVDYAMYTRDLSDEFKEFNALKGSQEKLEIFKWLKIHIERYSVFPVESLIRNKHMNNTNGQINVNECDIEMFLIGYSDYLKRVSE